MRDKASFKELFSNGKPPADVASEDDVDVPDDEPVTVGTMTPAAWPRPANKPLSRLHIVKNDGSVHTMMYYQLDSHSVYLGGHFIFLFTGAKHWEVKIRGNGPKVWEAYDYITLARWPFIVEATREFKPDDDHTVFEEISIRDVTPKER